jgi:recombination protein RecA
MDITKYINDIRKEYGEGSIMRLGDSPAVKVDVIPTGCPSLDRAIGVGGIPKGKMTEIFGPESAGKSTLCLHVIAEAQKQGGLVAYIDTEYAFDREYADNLGVKTEDLFISQPDSAEDVFSIIEKLADSGAFSVIVVDSVAALKPQAEINGEFGDSIMGVMPKLMSQACRVLVGHVAKSNTALIFVNQLRQKLGVTYGSNETTPGGMALKYYTSLRLDIRRIGQIKAGETVVGNRTKVKIVKNKLAAPFKTVEFDIIFNEGISKESDLLDIAIEKGVIVQKGAWFSHNGTNIAQGRENARIFLKNPEFYAEILQECSI